MRKVSVYIPAFAGTTVELEVEDNATDEQITELAAQEASLSDCTATDWDFSEPLEITDVSEEDE